MNPDKHSEKGCVDEAGRCQENGVAGSRTERAGARPHLLFSRKERVSRSSTLFLNSEFALGRVAC